MNDAIFIFSLNIQQSNVDLITVFFFKSTLATSQPQNFDFSCFFSKSRVRASSEIQTQTNC